MPSMKADDTLAAITLTTSATRIDLRSSASLTIQASAPIWWGWEVAAGVIPTAKRITAFGTGTSTYVIPLPADGGDVTVYLQGKAGGETVELATVRGRAG